MTSNRKVALLVGAATCLGAMIYAAPIFGADDSTMSFGNIEPIAADREPCPTTSG